MASTYLTKTFTASNRKTFTISFWIKRSGLTSNQCPFGAGTNHSTDRDFFAFIADSGEEDKLYFNSKISNSTVAQFYTSRRFRDINAWYHIVLAFDTTQATDTNRMKLYVNGEQETYQSVTYPSQNQDMNYNNTVHTVGSSISPSDYLDGCMSHFHFIDGTQYEASTFGETDATTGEWKINTSPSVTYGTNGFFILKDANGVTDQSGNSNNFTVGGGTLTTLQDNPSNNFSTLSPIIRTSGGAFSQVANTFTDTSGSYQTGFSSQGMLNGQGKYYAEFKVVSGSSLIFGIADYKDGGIIDRIQQGQTRYLGEYSNAYGYQSSGRFYYNGSSTTTDYTSFTTNDIIGLAVDMDNLKIYWHKNGTYQGAADPASNNGYTIVAPEEAYHMGISSASSVANANFGNGIFGTTAISSEGTNASGEGKFEYDVPSGYTALCTKGLNL